jgi:hypothetical protein
MLCAHETHGQLFELTCKRTCHICRKPDAAYPTLIGLWIPDRSRSLEPNHPLPGEWSFGIDVLTDSQSAFNIGADGNGYMQLAWADSVPESRVAVTVTEELDSFFLSNTADSVVGRFLGSRSDQGGFEISMLATGEECSWEIQRVDGRRTLESGVEVYLIGSGSKPYLTGDMDENNVPSWASMTEIQSDDTGRGRWVVEVDKGSGTKLTQTSSVYLKASAGDQRGQYLTINWAGETSTMGWSSRADSTLAPFYIHRRVLSSSEEHWMKRYDVNVAFFGVTSEESDSVNNKEYTNMGSHRLFETRHGLTLRWYSSLLHWKRVNEVEVSGLEGTWVPSSLASWSTALGDEVLNERNSISFGPVGNGDLKFGQARERVISITSQITESNGPHDAMKCRRSEEIDENCCGMRRQNTQSSCADEYILQWSDVICWTSTGIKWRNFECFPPPSDGTGIEYGYGYGDISPANHDSSQCNNQPTVLVTPVEQISCDLCKYYSPNTIAGEEVALYICEDYQGNERSYKREASGCGFFQTAIPLTCAEYAQRLNEYPAEAYNGRAGSQFLGCGLMAKLDFPGERCCGGTLNPGTPTYDLCEYFAGSIQSNAVIPAYLRESAEIPAAMSTCGQLQTYLSATANRGRATYLSQYSLNGCCAGEYTGDYQCDVCRDYTGDFQPNSLLQNGNNCETLYNAFHDPQQCPILREESERCCGGESTCDMCTVYGGTFDPSAIAGPDSNPFTCNSLPCTMQNKAMFSQQCCVGGGGSLAETNSCCGQKGVATCRPDDHAANEDEFIITWGGVCDTVFSEATFHYKYHYTCRSPESGKENIETADDPNSRIILHADQTLTLRVDGFDMHFWRGEPPAEEAVAAVRVPVTTENSAYVTITPANAGSVFCSNAKLLYRPDIVQEQQNMRGLLILENKLNENVTMRVRVTTVVSEPATASLASNYEQLKLPFIVKYCDNDGCTTTEPLTCFYDIMHMPPGAMVMVEPATEGSEIPIEFQAVRDEAVQYFDANMVNSLDFASDDGNCSSASSSSGSEPSSIDPWTECDANMHMQFKELGCTQQDIDGIAAIDPKICEALGLGSKWQRRSCCTKDELISAELHHASASFRSYVLQKMIQSLPPVWWCLSCSIAGYKWQSWHASGRWVFIGWSVPFGLTFGQYLVPWVTVMEVDVKGLVNMLLSRNKDTPSRNILGALEESSSDSSSSSSSDSIDSSSSSDSSSSDSSSDSGSSIACFNQALVGADTSLGVLQAAQEKASLAGNIDPSSATATLDQLWKDEASELVSSQYSQFLEHEEVIYDAGQRLVSMVYSTVALAPLALSLLPGIARGALFAKLVRPSSALPGWIIRLVPVFYVPMVSVILLAIVQLFSDGLFSLAILVFTGNAMLPLVFPSDSLTASYTTTAKFREKCFLFKKSYSTITTVLQLCALALFIGFAVRVMDSPDFEIDLDLDPKTLIILLVKSVVNYLLTTLLAADALLGLTLRQEVDEGKTKEIKDAHAQSFEAVMSMGTSQDETPVMSMGTSQNKVVPGTEKEPSVRKVAGAAVASDTGAGARLGVTALSPPDAAAAEADALVSTSGDEVAGTA